MRKLAFGSLPGLLLLCAAAPGLQAEESAGVVTGAVVGVALAGGLVSTGARLAPERWREVAVPGPVPVVELVPGNAGTSRLGLALAPIQGGVTVGLSCRF